MINTKKVAIIGSGPAGLTAAIYLSRAGIDTIIFTGNQIGGQLTTTTEIENFPGAWDSLTKQGVLGPKLMETMQKQAEHFGAKIEYQTISALEKKNSQFELFTAFGDSFIYDSVIIASGASARYLGLPDENKWVGKGYHTCATCDGFFYKGKIVAVVGGGDSAMEEASYLSKLCSKVYLIHRSNKYRASNIMLDRAKNNPKIEFLEFNAPTELIIIENKFKGIKIQNTQTQKINGLNLDGLFVAVGHVPNSNFVKGILSMDEVGYLLPRRNLLVSKLGLGEKVDLGWAKYGCMSELDGLFIAGDIEDKHYRQAITASGDGCRAAMDCEKWLEG